jgi:hypothetical protein
MLELLVQHCNQLMITLRCLPMTDPAYARVQADFSQARREMYAALCAACE